MEIEKMIVYSSDIKDVKTGMYCRFNNIMNHNKKYKITVEEIPFEESEVIFCEKITKIREEIEEWSSRFNHRMDVPFSPDQYQKFKFLFTCGVNFKYMIFSYNEERKTAIQTIKREFPDKKIRILQDLPQSIKEKNNLPIEENDIIYHRCPSSNYILYFTNDPYCLMELKLLLGADIHISNAIEINIETLKELP